MNRCITCFLLSLLLLFSAGCSTEDEGENDDKAVLLTENTWTTGSISSAASAVWYSFSVTSGYTYYVWWNDQKAGNGIYSFDVKVDASYSDGTAIFTGEDSAYSSAKSFTASKTDKVKLKVYPFLSGSTGTFAIVYSTSSTRPSVPNMGTWVRFINDNTFPVSIYSDSARQVKMADIEAGGRSAAIQTVPKPSGALFYPLYRFTVYGITIPYETDVIVFRIDEDKVNDAYVPSLKELADAEPNKKLTNDVYIVIQNNSTSSLTLRQGSNIELQLEGSDSPILNPNENGLYKISSGPVSGYSFMRGSSTPISFPSCLTEFSPAYLYPFRYDGTLTLQDQKLLTLAEIYKLLSENAGNGTGNGNGNGTGSGNGSESSPYLLTSGIWANGSITSTASSAAVWYSFNVTSGTRYNVWWNDSCSGNVTKTLDILVDASYYSNSSPGSYIFRGEDSAYGTPMSFTANQTGTVKLRVYPYSYSDYYDDYYGYISYTGTGTFAIVYSTSSTRPQ